MLLLAMLAAFSVGVIYIVQSEARLSGSDMNNAQVYYGAAAAMEKMVVDLNKLYAGSQEPAAADIEALGEEAYRPSLPGVTYPQYSLVVPTIGETLAVETRNVSAGPNQGLIADITPIVLKTTAQGTAGESVTMVRNVEIARIPIFQFGVFSHGDLSYYPSDQLEFRGRVHTNSNLFLVAGSELVFHSRMTAAKAVIRARLANGLSPSLIGLNQPIKIPTAPQGCEGLRPACRDLQLSEGSKTAGPDSSDNPDWANVSESIYNGMVLSGDTGGKTLNFPFSNAQDRSIELIRRPRENEDPASLLGRSRLYNQAQIRVLISDNPADLPGGTGVRLANVAPYYDGVRYGATDTAFAEDDGDGGPADVLIDLLEGLGLQDVGDGLPMIDGYLLVQARQADASYLDVTMEWLNLGIARENQDAILRFQTLKDIDGDGVPEYNNNPLSRRNPSAFLPLNLYDTREGEVRDTSSLGTTCALGGTMNVVELHVDNLRLWLTGRIRGTQTTGDQVETTSQNGYLFYFSDRRGMLPNGNGEIVGEYGYEDLINPSSPTGQPDGQLDPAEDVNENGILDTYGAGNIGDGTEAPNGDPTFRVDCVTVARTRRVSGARHALRLVNASAGSLPTKPDRTGGFTVASENPVYVHGNYNARNNGFDSSAVPAGIIADSVTFLSGNWADWRSFTYPTAKSLRPATTAYYEVAVAGGKNIVWTNPSWSSNSNDGLDGGVRHFLRSLEEWGGTQSFNFRGSLVSPFYAHYGVGVYKCCQSVFSVASFDYSFDTDLLDPAKMPPGTPRLHDIVILGFRQIFASD